MKLRSDQLKNLPVETRIGESLGRIAGFEVDAESHTIATYLVRPNRLVRAFVKTELRIARSQVLSITPERMVVDDAVRPAQAEKRKTAPGLTKDIAPVIPAETS